MHEFVRFPADPHTLRLNQKRISQGQGVNTDETCDPCPRSRSDLSMIPACPRADPDLSRRRWTWHVRARPPRGPRARPPQLTRIYGDLPGGHLSNCRCGYQTPGNLADPVCRSRRRRTVGPASRTPAQPVADAGSASRAPSVFLIHVRAAARCSGLIHIREDCKFLSFSHALSRESPSGSTLVSGALVNICPSSQVWYVVLDPGRCPVWTTCRDCIAVHVG